MPKIEANVTKKYYCPEKHNMIPSGKESRGMQKWGCQNKPCRFEYWTCKKTYKRFW